MFLQLNLNCNVCSGNYMSPDAGVGLSKRAHEEQPDSSPGSPSPLAIVESPEPMDKRPRLNDSNDHWTTHPIFSQHSPVSLDLHCFFFFFFRFPRHHVIGRKKRKEKKMKTSNAKLLFYSLSPPFTLCISYRSYVLCIFA